MNKHKVFFGRAAAILMLLLLLASCGAGRRATTEAGELYEVDFYTFSNGTFTYIAGIAIAETVNELHPWVRITPVESPGSGPNELMMYEADDATRRRTLYFAVAYNAYKGINAFQGRQHTRSKRAFNIGVALSVLVSTDANIRRIEDLAGRQVGIRLAGSTSNPYFMALFSDANVRDVVFNYLDWNAGAEGALSGSLSGWVSGFSVVAPDMQEWRGTPVTTEFLARARTLNFIDFNLETGRRLRTVAGGPFEDFYAVVTRVPALALDPRQTSPTYGSMNDMGMFVDQDFPEDVLFEIMRIVGSNRERLMSFHPQCEFITPQTMAIYTWPEEFHPGALRYFNSVGVRPTFLEDYAMQLAN